MTDVAEDTVDNKAEATVDNQSFDVLFEKLDKDGSGSLDQEEFRQFLESQGIWSDGAKMISRRFDVVDVDGNAGVDRAEFSEWWSRMQGPLEKLAAFDKRDTAKPKLETLLKRSPSLERYGKVTYHSSPRYTGEKLICGDTPYERSVGIKQLFKSMDRDGNLILSRSEFILGMILLGKDFDDGMKIFSEIDRDGSKFICLAEYDLWVADKTLDLAREKFLAMDTDGNRLLSQKEFSVLMKELKIRKSKSEAIFAKISGGKSNINFRDFETYLGPEFGVQFIKELSEDMGVEESVAE